MQSFDSVRLLSTTKLQPNEEGKMPVLEVEKKIWRDSEDKAKIRITYKMGIATDGVVKEETMQLANLIVHRTLGRFKMEKFGRAYFPWGNLDDNRNKVGRFNIKAMPGYKISIVPGQGEFQMMVDLTHRSECTGGGLLGGLGP